MDTNKSTSEQTISKNESTVANDATAVTQNTNVGADKEEYALEYLVDEDR